MEPRGCHTFLETSLTIADGLESANIQALALAGFTSMLNSDAGNRPCCSSRMQFLQSASADELTPKRGLNDKYMIPSNYLLHGLVKIVHSRHTFN